MDFVEKIKAEPPVALLLGIENGNVENRPQNVDASPYL